MALASMELGDKHEYLRKLEKRIASSCGAFGDIEKITLYSRHPDGVVIVRFGSNYAAQQCKERLHGQSWVPGEKLRVMYWDGHTDYSVDGIDIDEHAGGKDKQDRSKGTGGNDSKGGIDEEHAERDYSDIFDGYSEKDLPDELRLRTDEG